MKLIYAFMKSIYAFKSSVKPVKEIPLFRPWGQPSNMKLVADEGFEIDYLTRYLAIGGDLTPSFEKGKLVGIWISDCIIPKRKYRNKKNGKVYVVESTATNSTNSQDGQEMYLYYCEEEPLKKYVRSVEEFNEKFEEFRGDNQW